MERNAVNFRIIIAFAALLVALPVFAEWDDNGHRVVAATGGEQADIRQDLEDAIIGRGLVISAVAHVGDMLARTAADLGFNGSPFIAADVVEFCSALLTHRLTAADPSAIIHCPYRIAVYSLPDRPDTVYLAYTKPTASGVTPELEAVEKLLHDLVEEVL